MTAPRPARARARIALFTRCEAACPWCALAPTPRDDRDAFADLEAARAAHDEVVFAGGEPTLDPDLETLVARARTLGFTRIGLESHGKRLADAGFTARLARAGLHDVHVVLYGAEAAAHDYHAGGAGHFAQSFAAVAAARTAGLAVACSTPLTRSNYRVLAPLARLLTSRGVAAWCITVPRAADAPAAEFDRRTARLALALPFALHALEGARRASLPAWITSAPLCLLGPFAARALPAPERSFGSPCARCPARPRCPGVDPRYLARFAGDELAPRDDPGEPADPGPLGRVFIAPAQPAEGAAGTGTNSSHP